MSRRARERLPRRQQKAAPEVAGDPIIPRCRRCRVVLVYDHEYDDEYCGPCIDALADREQERREWAAYHPAEESSDD